METAVGACLLKACPKMLSDEDHHSEKHSHSEIDLDNLNFEKDE